MKPKNICKVLQWSVLIAKVNKNDHLVTVGIHADVWPVPTT